MLMTAVIKKWGNSLGFVIDSKVSKKIGLKEGQQITIDIVSHARTSAFGKFPFLKSFERDRDDHEF